MRLTGVGVSSNFFGSGGGLESRSLLLSFLQLQIIQRKMDQQSWRWSPHSQTAIPHFTITTHALLFFGNRGKESWHKCRLLIGHMCLLAAALLQLLCQWFRTHNHPLHNLRIFPASLKGVASIKWLTCLPPFFGLCWAPLLCPAPLQALLAPLVPSGALGPVAHSQPCSHLKGEARQFDWGKWSSFYSKNTLTLALKG